MSNDNIGVNQFVVCFYVHVRETGDNFHCRYGCCRPAS